MKSIVELEIEAPSEKVGVLPADPENMTKWMDDWSASNPQRRARDARLDIPHGW
jgi:hypothetical protein